MTIKTYKKDGVTWYIIYYVYGVVLRNPNVQGFAICVQVC